MIIYNIVDQRQWIARRRTSKVSLCVSDVKFVSLLAGRQSHKHWQQISDEHMCFSNSCTVGITLDILSERKLFLGIQQSTKTLRT